MIALRMDRGHRGWRRRGQSLIWFNRGALPKYILILQIGLAFLSTSRGAAADTQTDTLFGFDSFQIHNPTAPGGKKTNYSATGSNPHWSIAQWDIPGPKLSPFELKQKEDTTEFDATAPEASVQIIEAPPGTLVVLRQDGAVLPCSHANGAPRESDLFIGSDLKPDQFERLSLSQLSGLIQKAEISAVPGQAETNKACLANKGGAIVSIVMADLAEQPHQTFFYQLTVSLVCREEAGSQPCGKPHHEMTYFSKKNPFGVGDYLPLLGVPFVSGSKLTAIDVDLLPRLKMAIAAGPPSLDHDLSHWRVGGVYAGQLIWGDVTLQTGWRNYRLIAVTP